MTRHAVVLFNPRSSVPAKSILPNALLALAASFHPDRTTRIVDGNREADPFAALTGAVRETGAGVVAMTVMPGPQLEQAVPLARQLKAGNPGLRIVWGGYFPTQHARACLADECVDLVIRGHGDTVFEAWLETLDRNAPPPALAGLAYRDANTGVVVDEGLAAVPDPDQLPEFPYRLIPVDRYARQTFLGQRTFSLHTSYGCPFRCNFCAVVNMVEGRWLAQSASRVADTVERFVREWKADAIEFHDNNFFVSEDRTAEFSRRIRQAGISWWGEARIDTMLRFRPDTWRAMRDAGLRMVFMGAESASDAVLKRMDKGGTASVEQTVEIAARMRDHGIVPEFSFVVGSPPDPADDAERTMRFIARIKRVNPAAEIILYLYTPVPLQGALYDDVQTRGFAFPETLDEWLSRSWLDFAQRRSHQLPWVPAATWTRLRDFERVLNAYYPTSTDQRLTPVRRLILRAAASWRFRLGIYRHPLELRALQRWMRYQRPETSGF